MSAPVREIPRAVHLIGIGGAGMAPLAHCLAASECSVSGSDLRSSETTKQLEALDIKVFIGHAPSNLAGAKLLVVSDAIPNSNIELTEARVRGIPVIRRAECLDLLSRSRQAIMVSGAHGKSTTAAMVATMLDRVGAHPSFAIGAPVSTLSDQCARIDKGVHFIAEACEAFQNLAFYHPDVAIITNVDDDHLAHYGDQEKLDAAFLAFANRASIAIIANGDDPGINRIVGKMMRPITTFGFDESNHICAKNVELTVNTSKFDVQIGAKVVGTICLPTPGRHMIINALACIATGRLLGIELDAIAVSLAGFTGVHRRWQRYDAAGYIQLVDDYAHHPTEIAAIADTARSVFGRGPRTIIAFQPHLFSRTKQLASKFGRELAKFDVVYLLEIDGAGERDDGQTSSALIAREIREHGGIVESFDNVDDLTRRAPALMRDGDCLVVAGAGNIRNAAPRIADYYLKRAASTIGKHTPTDAPSASSRFDAATALAMPPQPILDVTVLTLLRQQIARYPDRPAVSEGDRTQSFADLDNTSERLARLLQDHGVAYGDVVGVRLKSSIELVQTAVALVKLGAVYLPLDVNLPSERMRFMLDDVNARLLVTTNDLPIDVHWNERRTLSLDRIQSELLRSDQSLAASTTTPSVRDNHSAYICFTSGSTGKPKGVSISHAALANFVIAARDLFQIDNKTRMILNTSISFDVSIGELWMTLCGGGELRTTGSAKPLIGERLGEFIERYAITHLAITPSVLTRIPSRMLPNLRCIISAGEACPQTLVDTWAPGRQFFNAYGPTETTIYATAGQCFAGVEVTIGRPFRNVTTRVLDAELRPVGLGETGELYIGGSGVGNGYINRTAETRERFIDWPVESERTERLYRTGDLVRQRVDGALEYIGRIDNQVKILGNRVELEEIEQSIMRDPSIVDAVVCVNERAGANELVCFAILKSDQEFDWATLREHLTVWLPPYMVPSHFVPVKEIPLTSSGKHDRKQLLSGYRRKALRLRNYCGPNNDIEAKLATIWKSLFEAEVEIGIYDDFTWLGGDSLKGLQLVAEIEKAFGITVPPGHFGGFTTIHRTSLQIAELLSSLNSCPGRASAGFRSLRVYKQLRDLTMGWRGARANPDAIIVSAGGSTPAYDLFLCVQMEEELHSIAEHLGPEFRVHAMRSGHLVMDYTPEMTVAVCEHYIEELEAIQPSGKLLIGGICQGGIIAATMANLMCERGHDIWLLVLLEQSRLIPHGGQVAFFYSEHSFLNPYRRFTSELARYEQTYGNRFSIDLIPGKHASIHLPPYVQIFARKLRARLAGHHEPTAEVTSLRPVENGAAIQLSRPHDGTSSLLARNNDLVMLSERTQQLAATIDELARVRELLGRSEAERAELQRNNTALHAELTRNYESKSWRNLQRFRSIETTTTQHFKRWVASLANQTKRLRSRARVRKKMAQDVILLEASPFFDKAYYVDQAGHRGYLARAPAHHYARVGWKQRLNPGPLFNTSSYLSRHPDVAAAGVNPLVHFHEWGMGEGRVGWSEQELMAWQSDLIDRPDKALRQITTRNKSWPMLRRDDTVVVHAHSRGHFVFQQFQQLLRQGFTATGVNCVCADESSCAKLHSPALRIVVAPHDFYYLDGSPSPDAEEFANSIPLNSEQMPSCWFAKALPFIIRAPFTLDINVQTAASLVRLGIDARFLPLGMVPENEIFQLQTTLPDEATVRWVPPAAVNAPVAIDAALETRGIDVLMIGSNSDRRQRFVAEHNGFFASKNCFIRLVQVTGALARSNQQTISPKAFAGLAQRSKILLNVHHFDMPYFEWQRLMHYGLMQCCCVVTERSSRIPGIIPGEHYFEDELSKLPGLMEWLLNDKDGWRRMDQVRRAGYAAAVSQFQLRRTLCELFGLPKGDA